MTNRALSPYFPIALIAGLALCLLLAPGAAQATGLLLPKDESLPPLAIQSHRVAIKISSGVATTAVDQVFHNSTNRDLEAVFVFPLPRGAAIDEFALYINGKRVVGEVLSADKARSTYESIVRRMRDPGLLEYVDGQVFRASIYPVPARGDQRVQLVFSQTLDYDNGVYSYVYPLRTGERASTTLGDFTIEARIKSDVPLRSVYSPTHDVEIERQGEQSATVGIETNAAALDRDFRLLYTVSDSDVGLSMVPYRTGGDDGYFLMMITPRAELEPDQALPKDVLFVFDTSGSMSGDKLLHAKQAARFFIDSLGEGDRFGLISFSTTVRPWRDQLVEATAQNRAAAHEQIESLKARGGTAIHEALLEAFELLGDGGNDGRPRMLVFLTDGLPTVGVTDIERIVEDAGKANSGDARLFCFGVGQNVNVHLLDIASERNGGVSEYVRGDEELELKLSSFFSKISLPVMSGLELEFKGIDVLELYPPTLPDLFAGSQVLVYGRYASAGDGALILSGNLLGEKQRIVHDVSMPKVEGDNRFVANLWANRKVGYLLDQVRLHGEKPELVDEIVRLGRDYGIVTPYTSYLVVQDESAPPAPVFGGGAIDGLDLGGLTKSGDVDRPQFGRLHGEGEESSVRNAPSTEQSGADAVRSSVASRERRESTQLADDAEADVRYVSGRAFFYVDGAYVDEQCRQGERVIEVPYASRAYFNLLEAAPEFRDYMMLAQTMKFSAGDGLTIFICQNGDAQRSVEDWRKLLGR
ncbi:MAG: VIT domain-containing protein [Candidatus Alcyoniella australis]|nr:VIT domain-containing protein [Candidatus Alcyoniella australis]